MEDPRAKIQSLPASVGMPLQVLVLAGVAVVAIIIGTVSVAGAFALFVLGLLATVIIDMLVSDQQGAAQTALGKNPDTV